MIFRFCAGSELQEETKRELTRFLDTQCTAHPFQYPGWAPLVSPLRSFAYCGWLEDGRGIRAFARCNVLHPASRLLPGVRAFALTRGPVCDDPELLTGFLSQLLAAARELGFMYVDISPEHVGTASEIQCWLESHGWVAEARASATLRLDLRRDCAALIASLRASTRYEIRRAEKAGVQVRSAHDRRDCEVFYDLLQRMASEKEFNADGRAHVLNVWQWISSEPRRGVLLLASHSGAVQGGVLLACAGGRAWYVWGASQKNLPYSVGHMLQWHAIQWAREAGCTEYDFGGYTPGATSGPAFFKQGFCNDVVHFLPAHRFVLNDARYERCQAWIRWRSGVVARSRGVRARSAGGAG
jgi:GNAT acetyltransferase-like protein